MSAVRGHRRWFLRGGVLVIALLLVVLAWRQIPQAPVPASVTWKPQPDQFPLGTAVQGSHVDFSVAFFTGQRAASPPAFFGRLPNSFRQRLENIVSAAQAASAKSRWKIRVETPPFVVVEESKVDFHSSHGAMVWIRAHLDTTRVGRWEGNLRASLRNRSGATNSIDLPVRVQVLPRPTTKLRKVLVTQSPFDMYSTDRGDSFLPLAQVTGHLAESGVQVDFRDQLPATLAGYDLILLAEDTLCDLPMSRIPEIQQRISRGTHVVLAADAFFVGTSPKASQLLRPYGLQMENQDAGWAVTNVFVVSDSLTDRVQHVGFHRPARITVTDANQGKVLVRDQERPGGFVAVSRAPGRGELRVVAQSLWWNWLKAEPAQADNVRLMENLLRP